MQSINGQTIGFIGLGLMGKPMCHNVMKGGANLVVTNRSPVPRHEMAEAGALAVDTPGEVAARTKTIILMVADTSTVESVLLGDNGVIKSLQKDSLVIDMGTTAVLETRSFGRLVEQKDGYYVDAPVSGGTIGAELGELTIMAGGNESAFAKALPALQILGKRITHVGGTGAGQVAKAANQVIVGLNIGAVAEAFALAKAAGVEPAKVREALQGGFADSQYRSVPDRDFHK
jgi:3-hydroxyisobutyrate dehydrogenase-like beta-hydroxyacid dehydrogenase